MGTFLLGVDVGKTACKAIVVDVSGSIVALGERPTPCVEVPTGGEMRADAFEGAVVEAIREGVSKTPEGTVVAVGVTGMGETGFLIDRDGRALTPGISWDDHRGASESDALARSLGREAFETRTGLPLKPG